VDHRYIYSDGMWRAVPEPPETEVPDFYATLMPTIVTGPRIVHGRYV